MKSNETKNLIAQTLYEMIKRKGLDKITVTDLVEECHISRQTFYYHFQDLFEVIEWGISAEFKKAVEYGLHINNRREAIHTFVEKTVHEYHLINILINSKHGREIEKYYNECLHAYFREILKDKAPDINFNVTNLEMSLYFFSYGLTGLLLDYYQTKELSIDEITQQICSMLDNVLPDTDIIK